MTSTTSSMTILDFFDSLLGRDQTRDLALELVHVYDQRQASTGCRSGRR